MTERKGHKVAKNTVSAGTIMVARNTLVGDVASFLIDRLRGLECAYRYLSEENQKEVIADAKRVADDLVEKAVGIIAADGRDTMTVKVKMVQNDGDKIRATIECRKEDEHRLALFDAAGGSAYIAVANPEDFQGGETPQPDPDQPDLPAGGGPQDETA